MLHRNWAIPVPVSKTTIQKKSLTIPYIQFKVINIFSYCPSPHHWTCYPPISLIIENDVCYLVMCDKMFSKRSAFTYLEDLAQEFHKTYGRKVNTVTRPYAFIEFDVYIQKTKKNLTDRRRNINSINNQLQDVQRIMVKIHSFSCDRYNSAKQTLFLIILIHFAGPKYRRCPTTRYSFIRIGYQNTESINAFTEIQKGCHVFESQIDVC